MHPKTLWSLCVALAVAIVAGIWLMPGPAAQARPQHPFVITPTGLPPTATSPAVTDTPAAATNTATPQTGATSTATPVGPNSTPVAPTGTASSPDSTATPRPTRAPAPPGSPSLRISKSSSSSAGAPGDFVTFTLTASNEGSSAANDVTISDNVPDFLEIYNVKTTKGIASNKGQTVSVKLDSLEPGETVVVTILVRIRDDATPQDGSNVGVIARPGEQQITSERVRISVLPKATAAPTQPAGAGTGADTSPATPAATPAALPRTNEAGGDLQTLILFFAVGVMVVSIGWAVLGVRRR